ncbi:putative ubiquitin-conjugating enzyme/RWD [Helianthus annuus]|nr:putative ubiquitin-conjugating enzyme/RWD [Helianthus annuus]
MTGSSTSSRKVLSKVVSIRIQKELAEWQLDPPPGFLHKVTDDLQRFFTFIFISDRGVWCDWGLGHGLTRGVRAPRW